MNILEINLKYNFLICSNKKITFLESFKRCLKSKIIIGYKHHPTLINLKNFKLIKN